MIRLVASAPGLARRWIDRSAGPGEWSRGVLVEGGRAIEVSVAGLDDAAGVMAEISGELSGQAAALTSALSAAADAVGDPGAAGALAAVLDAWAGPVGVLGPLVKLAGAAVQGAGRAYEGTDGAIARAAG